MTSTTSTTTTCSVTTVTNATEQTITTGQTELTISKFFDVCKEGMSNIFSFSEKVLGQTVIAIKSFTDKTPHLLLCPKDVYSMIFTCKIPRPEDLVALSSTCKDLHLTSKPLHIYAHANVFASQPASSITVDSYKRKVAELEKICPDLSRLRIATVLRQAILSVHKDAFVHLSNSYADDLSQESRTLTQELRSQFEEEKMAFEMELGALCGPNGSGELCGIKAFNAQMKEVLGFRTFIGSIFQLFHFYAELATVVTVENEEHRFKAMESIIR